MPLSQPPASSSSASIPQEAARIKYFGNYMYSLPGVDAISAATTTITANKIRYFPFYVTNTITLDRLMLEVSTASGSAGSTARMGIYNVDNDNQVTTLIVDGGTVATDSTGVKTVTINQQLTAGRYLFAQNASVNYTARMIRGGGRYVGYIDSFGGSPMIDSLNATQTYGALPSTGTAWDTASAASTPFIYVVFCRIASIP